jgi:palmitoyltransferase
MEGFLRRRWRLARITFLSMFYNCHLSTDYVFDTLMQPAFWFVDGFALILGPIFVSLVIFLTSSVVFIAFWIGLPYYIEHKSPLFIIILVIIGHYFLVNIVFHFMMAWLTHPGRLPSDTVHLPQVVTTTIVH